jgi:hypothetical protein
MTLPIRYYVVSYDLRQPVGAQDYILLANALRTAPDFCRALYSFWIVGTNLSPGKIIDNLVIANLIQPRDSIIVLEITGKGDFFGAQPTEIADWLRNKLTLV